MKGLAVYFLSHRGLDSLDNGIEGSGDEIAKTNTPNQGMIEDCSIPIAEQ